MAFAIQHKNGSAEAETPLTLKMLVQAIYQIPAFDTNKIMLMTVNLLMIGFSFGAAAMTDVKVVKVLFLAIAFNQIGYYVVMTYTNRVIRNMLAGQSRIAALAVRIAHSIASALQASIGASFAVILMPNFGGFMLGLVLTLINPLGHGVTVIGAPLKLAYLKHVQTKARNSDARKNIKLYLSN